MADASESSSSSGDKTPESDEQPLLDKLRSNAERGRAGLFALTEKLSTRKDELRGALEERRAAGGGSLVPSELRMRKRMEESVEDMAISVAVGLAVGGVLSLVLTRRGGSARPLLTGFGGGIGAGSSWTQSRMQPRKALSSSDSKSNSDK